MDKKWILLPLVLIPVVFATSVIGTEDTESVNSYCVNEGCPCVKNCPCYRAYVNYSNQENVVYPYNCYRGKGRLGFGRGYCRRMCWR